MQRRLRLSEFSLYMVYEKTSVNTQAHAISRFKSLGHAIAPHDEKIYKFTDYHLIQKKQVASFSDLDVSDYIQLTHEDLKVPELVRITSAWILREQGNDQFCRNIVDRKCTGKDMAFCNGMKKYYFASRTNMSEFSCPWN